MDVLLAASNQPNHPGVTVHTTEKTFRSGSARGKTARTGRTVTPIGFFLPPFSRLPGSKDTQASDTLQLSLQ